MKRLKIAVRHMVVTCVRSCVAAVALCLGALHAGAGVSIEGNTMLNGDTDYRGQGTVTIAADATLDLNGHNLWVDALAGAGHITDSKYYESLDYVQANGDQSVTTDYTPGVGTKIEVDFSPEANDGKPHALYATGTWGTYQFLCMVNAGGFYFFGKGGPNLKVVDGTRYCSILENGTISLVQQADGVKIGDAQVDQSYAGDNSLVFFDTPQTAGFRGHYKLYGARVWHNGEPRLDLVPVRQAGTEAVGLFNRLNGDFFASNTGTSLIAGTATGAMLGRGSLRVAAMDGVPLFGFVGTVDHQVRKFVDGDFTLSGDADWSAFGEYSLCGSVDLNGHKLTVNSLTGDATITSTADAGYDLLEYVDSDGNAYVDTGVTVADDTVIDIKVRMLKDPGNNYVSYVGARDQNARIGQLGGWFYSLNHYQGVTHPEELLGPAALNTDYTVHLDKSGPCTIDGEPFATGSGSGNGYTITIFGMNQEGGVSFKGSFRVYSCCIAYGTEVQCGLKPARRRSDGAVGFLNVNAPSKFYANVGSGALIAGPVVSEEYAKQPAELHVNVANGQTTENTGIAITGPVRVIKEGAGTLVATKAGQSFTCGLFVEGGTFKCGNVGSAYVYGPNGGMVTVRTGATFDCDGWWNHYGHHFVLDGGTIKSQNNRATARQAWFADVALTKDSFWYGCNYGFIGSDWGPCRLQMNAHTLTVDVTNGGDFFAGNLTVEGGGEIYMRTGGWFGIGGMSVGGQSTRNTYFKAEATTLRMGGAAFEDFGGEHVLGSYISEYTGNHDRASTVVKVLNRFVPGEKWHSTELQDGATLDLSAYASTWNTTCEFTSSVTTGTATFAEGATIYLELGERKVDVSEPIITWSEKPTHVKFRAAQESGLRFSVKSDGLYVSQGFGIIIR